MRDDVGCTHELGLVSFVEYARAVAMVAAAAAAVQLRRNAETIVG